jgi:predicted glycogen debranching enzyme
MLSNGDAWLKPSFQEWLEADGLGGFSASTSSGIHTRRYHGWLFLGGQNPGDRWLALSKVEDTCVRGDRRWELSSNLYPGCIHPDGEAHLLAFSKQPFPRFVFKIGDTLLQREMFMAKGMPGVFCAYSILHSGADSDGLTLVLRPLCNSRFYHHTAREGSWVPKVFCRDGAVLLEKHHACDTLALVCTGSVFTQQPAWYRNMTYPVETQRGLDSVEDHFSPGHFECHLAPGDPVVLWAGPVSKQEGVRVYQLLDTREKMSLSEWCQGLAEHARRLRGFEAARRARIQARARGNKALASLYLAADQFIVEGNAGTSIIAGYHWFGEWGRDTFIAMPGLLFTTKRFAEAREVFMRFAREIREGLVPNCFVEGHGAAYNSVDASLWFIDALAKYEQASGDWEFVKQMIPKVGEIIDGYIHGTGNGIKMHSSGLLKAGNRDTQLTWMDARVDGNPVTPRDGFPVEVNALWIRALSLYGNWLKKLIAHGYSGKTGADGTKYSRLAGTAAKRFRQLFIWPGVGLYDRLDEHGPVAEVRPNQVIAGGIAELRLPQQTLVEIWTTAFEKLLCPHGLRTLAPDSPGYRGKFAGGPEERDGAYHQGSAWPWLFGPLFDLSLMLFKTRFSLVDSASYPELKQLAYLMLSHVLRLDSNPCIGTIFEVASADYPFEPGGTVSQAWSVAEIIRILYFFETVPQGDGASTGPGPDN